MELMTLGGGIRRFKVSDQNLVTNLQIAEPACIGTP